MKQGFNIMFLLYGTMGGIPVLMWLIAVTSPFPTLLDLRLFLGLLLAIGSLIFSVIAFKEVFGNG